MEWKLKLHRKALKGFNSLDVGRKRLVKEKLMELLERFEEGRPLLGLDVKKLKGEWEGFLRLRVGDVRVIFKVNFEERTIYVYNIHKRKGAY